MTRSGSNGAPPRSPRRRFLPRRPPGTPGRRSSSATSPCRTTSWSSTTRRRQRTGRRLGHASRMLLVGPALGTRTISRSRAGHRCRSSSVPPIRLPLAIACWRGPGGRAATPPGRTRRPLSSIRSSSAVPSRRSTSSTVARVAPGMADDVAEGLVDDRRGDVPVVVGDGLVETSTGMRARGRSSSCGGTPRRSRQGRRRATCRSRSSGRRPKMKLRMSWIVRWRQSIARSTPPADLVAVVAHAAPATSSSDSPTA